MDDRETIFRHISLDNPAAAIAMDDLFVEKAHILLDHPMLGRSGRLAGTREFVVHRNYLLIYRMRPREILILRVLHGARKWPPYDE